jgi:hypothetical protein
MGCGSVAKASSLCFSRRVPDEPRGGAPSPLELEARVLSRYLVGRVPQGALLSRYGDAIRTLLPEPGSAPDEAVVSFVRRHPWSVSLLDAACGLALPRARLREKILVMAAVLEASPDFAEEFLPRTAGRAALLAQLAWLGCLAAARALAGLVLLPIAARPVIAARPFIAARP